MRRPDAEHGHAFLDFLGGETAEARALGVPASRVFTILDWDAVDEHRAVRASAGDVVALGRVAALAAARRIRLPIADVFPLDAVADAYRALDKREAPGKIVLGLRIVSYPGQRVREPEIKEQDVTLGVPTPHRAHGRRGGRAARDRRRQRSPTTSRGARGGEREEREERAREA